jgi:uncharacterized repeat protein (TIGR01451 family)
MYDTLRLMKRIGVITGVLLGGVVLLVGQGAAGVRHGRWANLSVAIVGPSSITIGSDGSFRMLVTNSGPLKATHVEVDLSLPPGVTIAGSTGGRCRGFTCRLGSIAPARFKVTTIKLSASQAQVGPFTALAFSKEQDSDFSNNSWTIPLVAQPSPALADVAVSIAPSKSPPPGESNAEVWYTVTFSNHGPGVALLLLNDYQFASSLTVRGYQDGTTCGIDPLVDARGADFAVLLPHEFCIPRLDPGQSREFQIAFSRASVGTWSVDAGAVTPDPDPSNNTAQATL